MGIKYPHKSSYFKLEFSYIFKLEKKCILLLTFTHKKINLVVYGKIVKNTEISSKESIFPIHLESRAEAHTEVAEDVAVVEVAAVEARVPSSVRIALRRRPVAVRKALVRVVTARYAQLSCERCPLAS